MLLSFPFPLYYPRGTGFSTLGEGKKASDPRDHNPLRQRCRAYFASASSRARHLPLTGDAHLHRTLWVEAYAKW
jgi:hypothetical protein